MGSCEWMCSAAPYAKGDRLPPKLNSARRILIVASLSLYRCQHSDVLGLGDRCVSPYLLVPCQWPTTRGGLQIKQGSQVGLAHDEMIQMTPSARNDERRPDERFPILY